MTLMKFRVILFIGFMACSASAFSQSADMEQVKKLLNRASAAVEMNDIDGAIGEYKKVLAIQKDNPAVLKRLGELYEQQNKYKDAYDHYVRFLELAPSDPEAPQIETKRDKLEYNTKYFRTKMTEAGFDIKPGDHPIVPIMLYEAVVAQNFAAKLLEEGVYVIGFFYPVVAKGLARIRVQLSAAHQQHHLDKAIAAFTKVGKELGVLNA